MNYLKELNAFYEWVCQQPELSNSARLLWHALMQINNDCGWKEEFNVSMSRLEVMTDMHKSSIIRARNKLVEYGRIEYKARSGGRSTVYKMISFSSHNGTRKEVEEVSPFHSGTRSDTRTDTGDPLPFHSGTRSDTRTDTRSDSIPKLKLKLKDNMGKKNAKKKADAFQRPTVEEVASFVMERGSENDVDPQRFLDYYDSIGWMRGKNKIKDWKACVRTWERNAKERRRYPQVTSKSKTQRTESRVERMQKLIAEEEARERECNNSTTSAKC